MLFTIHCEFWMFFSPFNGYLGGGFKYFLFSPLLGEMIHFDYFFQMGWNHQLDIQRFLCEFG